MTQFLTRQKAQDFREQDTLGYEITLPISKSVVHVRRLSLNTLALTAGIPAHMQERVGRIFREAQENGTFLVKGWGDLVRNQSRQLEIANPLCIAGFMQPQLTETKEEADAAGSDDVLWIEEVDPDDRIYYMNSILNPLSEAAKALTPFSGEGLSGAQPGEAGTVAPASVDPAANGAELRPSDVSGI